MAHAHFLSLIGADVPLNGAISLRQPASPLAQEVHLYHDYVMVPVMVSTALLALFVAVWIILRYRKKAEASASERSLPVSAGWVSVMVIVLMTLSYFSVDLLDLGGRMPDGQVHEYDEGTTAAAVPNEFPRHRRVTKSSHIEVEIIDKRTGAAIMLDPEDDYDIAGYGEDRFIVALARPVPVGSLLRVTSGRGRVGAKPYFRTLGNDQSTIIPKAALTITAVGGDGGWTYRYPDFGGIAFTSEMAREANVEPSLYRLATTNDVVIPAGVTVRLLVTAEDMIYSWALPAFAVNIDAVPGRYNQTWLYSEELGTYYGQCTKNCSFAYEGMPISVRVVAREEFEDWVDIRREMNGLDPIFAPMRTMAMNGHLSKRTRYAELLDGRE